MEIQLYIAPAFVANARPEFVTELLLQTKTRILVLLNKGIR
jgi:hypothetical protein